MALLQNAKMTDMTTGSGNDYGKRKVSSTRTVKKTTRVLFTIRILVAALVQLQIDTGHV